MVVFRVYILGVAYLSGRPGELIAQLREARVT